MSLIGRLVDKLLTQGTITLLLPGKKPRTLGPGGGKHLTVRFADRKVAFDIVRNPRLGAGEAYMDGRLVIEDGTILDLLELIVGSNRWEEKGEGRAALSKGKNRIRRFLKRNTPTRARRNVAHHYDLKDELYELFLDADKQYSCAYFTDPGNSLEQAQADKKAHIAAKLALAPGQRVLDIGCGWGGMALYLHQVAGVDVLGVTLVRASAQDRAPTRQGGGRRRSCEVRADRLPQARRPLRPDRLGRHVRACRRQALRRILRPVPQPAEARRRDAAAYHRQARRSVQGPRPVHRQIYLPRLPFAVAEPDERSEREGAADRQRRREFAAALCADAAPLARPRDQSARGHRGDVRRTLLPDVGILPRPPGS